MTGIAQVQRDLERVRSGLEAWFRARRPDRTGLTVAPLRTSPHGVSSESYFMTVTWDGGTDELVARLPPEGGGVYIEYDLAKQHHVQQVLEGTEVPVAHQVGYEASPEWIGCEFLVMERVAGRVPGDMPPYFVAGWLHDADPATRRGVATAFAEALADIGRQPAMAFDAAVVGRAEGPGAAGELAWFRTYVEWGTEGEESGRLHGLLEWCERERPADEPPPALVWGDAKLPNVIVAEGADGASEMAIAAVLDWEMVTLGAPENDLGWWMGHRRHYRTLHGLDPDRPELPGFPEDGELLDRYVARLGRDLHHYDWYLNFAMLRYATTIQGVRRALRAIGETDHYIFQRELVQDWVWERTGG